MGEGESEGAAAEVANAAFQAPAAAELRTATIEAGDGSRLFMGGPDGAMIDLHRAPSCLVAPAAGDRVLVAEAGGRAYVLAVLEREGDAPLRIETDGDLELVADRISLKASVFELAAGTATLVGRAFNSMFRTIKRVAGTETVIAQSTSLSAGERVSTVAGADVQQAGVFSQHVDGALAVKSHTAIVSAKTDIRLNGERINVG